MKRDTKRRKIRNQSDRTINNCCVFCRSNSEDELRFGKLCKLENISVHKFCTFLSSGLCQKGNENDHFEGFLIEDILQEERRGLRLRCSYCKHTGATIGCVVKSCRKVFHLNCGQENGALNQFFGNFCSFCTLHKPEQIISTNDVSINECCMCGDNIDYSDSGTYLRCPCCTSGVFHRICIQRYANNSGYFFKCPLCNDVESFRDEMLFHGINVPERDASWETEENAFQELLVALECSAKICLCSGGRNVNKKNTKWTLQSCSDCGSSTEHLACRKFTGISRNKWTCNECIGLNEEIQARKNEMNQTKCNRQPEVSPTSTVNTDTLVFPASTVALSQNMNSEEFIDVSNNFIRNDSDNVSINESSEMHTDINSSQQSDVNKVVHPNDCMSDDLERKVELQSICDRFRKTKQLHNDFHEKYSIKGKHVSSSLVICNNNESSYCHDACKNTSNEFNEQHFDLRSDVYLEKLNDASVLKKISVRSSLTLRGNTVFCKKAGASQYKRATALTSSIVGTKNCQPNTDSINITDDNATSSKSAINSTYCQAIIVESGCSTQVTSAKMSCPDICDSILKQKVLTNNVKERQMSIKKYMILPCGSKIRSDQSENYPKLSQNNAKRKSKHQAGKFSKKQRQLQAVTSSSANKTLYNMDFFNVKQEK